eukprot:GHVH01010035.1.p1 GENE.GHVH01010035.1~~GHVH01010035.1.p1  ORF type:complete len:147 (+),score=21.27 GHVH01010035.1:139-579(+)
MNTNRSGREVKFADESSDSGGGKKIQFAVEENVLSDQYYESSLSFSSPEDPIDAASAVIERRRSFHQPHAEPMAVTSRGSVGSSSSSAFRQVSSSSLKSGSSAFGNNVVKRWDQKAGLEEWDVIKHRNRGAAGIAVTHSYTDRDAT